MKGFLKNRLGEIQIYFGFALFAAEAAFFATGIGAAIYLVV